MTVASAQLHASRFPTTHNIEQKLATCPPPSVPEPRGRQPAAQVVVLASGFETQWAPSGSPVEGVSEQRLSARLHLRPVGQSLSWEQTG